MRLFLLLAALSALPAQAEIYRWIERDTGSIKFSNMPPPWYGDPERERSAPAVEVIRGPAAPAPSAPPVKPLEARWGELLKFFAALPATTDFAAAGAGVERQLEAYQALRAELDRVDPAGAARRQAQEEPVMERLRRGLQAQFGAKPPAQ